VKRLFLALGSPLFALLKHPGLVIEIGAVFVIALVWFAGPLVGFDSVAARVQIIIGIGLLRAAVHVVQYLLVQRRGAKLEESLRQEGARQVGSARPDRKEEIDVASKAWVTVIDHSLAADHNVLHTMGAQESDELESIR
jgi:type VI protein secretion system component VasK